jgi:hypothetical protein
MTDIDDLMDEAADNERRAGGFLGWAIPYAIVVLLGLIAWLCFGCVTIERQYDIRNCGPGQTVVFNVGVERSTEVAPKAAIAP